MKAYLQVDILVGIILALIMFVTLWFCYRNAKSSLGKFWRVMSIVFLILLITWVIFMIINTHQESSLLSAKIASEETADVIESGSAYGYCPFGGSVRTDPYGSNCPECSQSVHGCCPDLKMLARDVEASNCTSECLECSWFPENNTTEDGENKLICAKWSFENGKNILKPCSEICCPPNQRQNFSMEDYDVYSNEFQRQGMDTHNTNRWDPIYQMMKLQNQINDLENKIDTST